MAQKLNPSKLFDSMLYEAIQHFGIVGDGSWYMTKGKQGSAYGNLADAPGAD